ncbi:MAG: hypothetical protein IBX50_11585 [Marinospirillum sp.]|uniref:hypothetical protein n=1 Tax=Marinospirillum sp. TaxID=2183934 RepID=UPI001A0A8EAE|nr:hypothetical protein [Marinospirillum sp.]MBE0507339.1 hypothetical protein [Marinospirillum sp.]
MELFWVGMLWYFGLIKLVSIVLLWHGVLDYRWERHVKAWEAQRLSSVGDLTG